MCEKKENGLVKWFSVERGYGYITNNENIDFYFGIKDVEGSKLPENGDKVSFNLYSGKEGSLSAKDVIIIEKKIPVVKELLCNSCKINVEPKLWYYGGSDYTKVSIDFFCPLCGYKILKKGGGFNLFAKIIILMFSSALIFIYYKISI